MDLQKYASITLNKIQSLSNPVIVGHYDADGIAGTAILSVLLNNMDVAHSVVNVKSLDQETLNNISSLWDSAIFVDIGSGYIDSILQLFNEDKFVIVDHHNIQNNSIFQFNPLKFGYSEDEISGAGLSFYLAHFFDRHLDSLAKIGIVGAVADLQDRSGSLTGLNKKMLQLGVNFGNIKVEKGLRFFGISTRPLDKFLAYSSNPYIPEISGDPRAAREFLSSFGNVFKYRGSFKTYAELTTSERKLLYSNLLIYLVQNGNDPGTLKYAIGENYIFVDEDIEFLSEAHEFAYVLNACGRTGNANIGVKIASGDRQNISSHLKIVIDMYRKELSKGFGLLNNAQDLGPFLFLNGVNLVRSEIIGTILSVGINSGILTKLSIGAALDNFEWVKISARCPDTCNYDLSQLMASSAVAVGGVGGGHAKAAGAKIPFDRLDEFLKILLSKLNHTNHTH